MQHDVRPPIGLMITRPILCRLTLLCVSGCITKTQRINKKCHKNAKTKLHESARKRYAETHIWQDCTNNDDEAYHSYLNAECYVKHLNIYM